MKNSDRTARTRGLLIAAARARFAAGGFAATSTKQIIEDAGVTRGALYHHFQDKADLFEAVCHELWNEATRAIETSTSGIRDPVTALQLGSASWIEFVSSPGVRRILVLEAPTVLGWERWNELDADAGGHLLRRGVEHALTEGSLEFDAGADALSTLLNGAMNAIVLASGRGRDTDTVSIATGAVRELLERLRAPDWT